MKPETGWEEGVSAPLPANTLSPTAASEENKMSIKAEYVSDESDEDDTVLYGSERSNAVHVWNCNPQVQNPIEYDSERLNNVQQLGKLNIPLLKGAGNEPKKYATWKRTTETYRPHGRNNTVKATPGTNAYSKNAFSPIDAWQLFFSDDLLQQIVHFTNLKINSYSKSTGLPMTRGREITDLIEIRAFIGLQYARALSKRNEENTKYLFRAPSGHTLFPATMWEGRFKFLKRMITFDDEETRRSRYKSDRFAAFRDVFEMFSNNCSRALNPDLYLCVDETVYSHKWKLFGVQNHSLRQAPSGIVFKSINSVSYPYIHRITVCTGEPEGTPGEFYVPSGSPVIKSLVSGLSSLCPLDGNNITVDKQHNSLELAEWLLARNLTAVGTVKADKYDIPLRLTTIHGREFESYEVYSKEDDPRLTLHSFAFNSNIANPREMKILLILSSMTTIPAISKEDQIPEIFQVFDFVKGSSDELNERLFDYTTNIKSRRWTNKTFSYVLDAARVNAQTVFALNMKRDPKRVNSFEFGWDLVMDLVLPQLRRRHAKATTPKYTKNKIDIYLNLQPNLDCRKSVASTATTKVFLAETTPASTVSGTSPASSSASTNVETSSTSTAPAASCASTNAEASSSDIGTSKGKKTLLPMFG